MYLKSGFKLKKTKLNLRLLNEKCTTALSSSLSRDCGYKHDFFLHPL